MNKLILIVLGLGLIGLEARVSNATCKKDCMSHWKVVSKEMMDLAWAKKADERNRHLYLASKAMLAFIDTHCQECTLSSCPANLKDFDQIVVRAAKEPLNDYVKRYEDSKIISAIHRSKVETAIGSIRNLMPIYEDKVCPTKK